MLFNSGLGTFPPQASHYLMFLSSERPAAPHRLPSNKPHRQAFVYRVSIDPVNLVASQCPALKYSLSSNALPQTSAFSARLGGAVLPHNMTTTQQLLCPNLESLLLVADGLAGNLPELDEIKHNKSPIGGITADTVRTLFGSSTKGGHVKEMCLYAYGKVNIASGIYELLVDLLGGRQQGLLHGLQRLTMLGTNDLSLSGGYLPQATAILARVVGRALDLRSVNLIELDGGKGCRVSCSVKEFVSCANLGELVLPPGDSFNEWNVGELAWTRMWRLKAHGINDVFLDQMSTACKAQLRYCDFNGTGGLVSDKGIRRLVEAGTPVHHLAVSFCGGKITDESIASLYVPYDRVSKDGINVWVRCNSPWDDLRAGQTVPPFELSGLSSAPPALRSLRSLDVARTAGRITENSIIHLIRAISRAHGEDPSHTNHRGKDHPPAYMLTTANKHAIANTRGTVQSSVDRPWNYMCPRYDGAPVSHMVDWESDNTFRCIGAARVQAADPEIIQGYLAAEPCVAALIERLLAHPQTQNNRMIRRLLGEVGADDTPVDCTKSSSPSSTYTTRVNPHDPKCLSSLKRLLTPPTTPAVGLRQLFVNFNSAVATPSPQGTKQPCFTDALLYAIIDSDTRWTLTALDLSNTGSVVAMSSTAIIELGRSCPNLRYLNIEKCAEKALFVPDLVAVLHPDCILFA